MSIRSVRALAIALVVAVAVPVGAREHHAADRGSADRSSDLDAAQRALDGLRYEEALPLLERAWRSGQNGPQALARVFRLQGEVAATLGDEAAARRAFARWLALVPDAHLDAGTSPKLAAVFEAARKQLDGAGLHVEVEIARGGAAVALVVGADPLAMIAGARASYRGEGGVQGVVEGKGGARIELPLPTAGRFQVVVAAVDSYGNRLVERPIVVGEPGAKGAAAPAPAKEAEAAPPPAAPPPAAPLAPLAPAAPGRPLYASPWLWAGVGAGFAIVGGVFAVRAGDAQSQLDALNASSSRHSFAEAQVVEDRLRTSALVADVSFAAAGASVVAALLLALQPEPAASATGVSFGARPLRGGGSFVLAWHF